MRTLQTIILALLLSLVSTATANRCANPEGVTGSTACAAGTPDEDCTMLANDADTKCAEAAAFVAIPASSSFAAQAENCIPFGQMAEVADPTASPVGGSGAYMAVPVGYRNAYAHGIACHGLTTNSYDLYALTQGLGDIWVEAYTPPARASFPADNRDAARLLGDLTAWGWQPIGRYDTLDAFRDKVNTTPLRSVAVTTGDILIIRAEAEVKIDCLFATPTSAPELDKRGCPSEIAPPEEPTVADYVIKEIGANTFIEDGVLEAFVPQANALQATGGDFGQLTTWTKRFAWDDSTNRLLFWIQGTLAGLPAATTTGDDQLTITNDPRVEFVIRFADQMRVLDASTYKMICNNGGHFLESNYPSGSGTSAYDFPAAGCSAVYSANVLTLEGFIQPSEDLTAGMLVLFDGLVVERTAGVGQTYQYWRCATSITSDPSCWGVAELSATVMDTPADTTAPILTGLTLTPGETTIAYTVTSDEAGSCTRGIDTTVDGDVAVVNTAAGSTVGLACNGTVTGLTAGQAIEVKVCVTDAAGNTGCAVEDTTTTSASGETFYIDPSGSGGICSEVAPCGTFAAVIGKATFGPGDTIIYEDGTYTNAAGETPLIDCNSNPSKYNGTSALRITVKARNERKAFMQATNWGNHPVQIENCAYWVVQGLRVEAADINGSNVNGHVVAMFNGTNNTFRRNLIRFNNRYKNGNVVSFSGSTGTLIEENEVYSFHRNGIGGGQNNIYRRNYVNSRNRADISGGFDSNNDNNVGDSGYILYPSNNNMIENNISEGNQIGYDFQALDLTRNNQLFGNISLNDFYGVVFTARGSTAAKMPIDNIVTNFLALFPTHYGFFSRAGRNNRCINCTLYGSTHATSSGGFYADQNSSNWPGDGNYSVFGLNVLMTAVLGRGINISQQDAWQLAYVNSVANGAADSPSSSSNYVSKTSLTAGMGKARLCVPAEATNLKGTGEGGADRGANILHQSQNGVVNTNLPLWLTTKPGPLGGSPDSSFPTATAGRYPKFCGARVAGVNDVAGDSCFDVLSRLFPGANSSEVTDILNSCKGSTY